VTVTALNQFDFDSLKSPVQITQAYAGPLIGSSRLDAPALAILPNLPNGLRISRTAALRGAKSAMTAIGLEAAAALCIYSLWLVWNAFR